LKIKLNNMKNTIPSHYLKVKKIYKEYIDAVENLGETARKSGPIDKKTSHLIQLAAAVAIGSEGSVHSHTRQAVEAGATAKEIQHTIILLTSTIGFPTIMAGLSWVNDILEIEKKK
jgi:4-carboxymuconolactone decarboxylase